MGGSRREPASAKRRRTRGGDSPHSQRKPRSVRLSTSAPRAQTPRNLLQQQARSAPDEAARPARPREPPLSTFTGAAQILRQNRQRSTGGAAAHAHGSDLGRGSHVHPPGQTLALPGGGHGSVLTSHHRLDRKSVV